MRPSVPNLHKPYPVPVARGVLYVLLSMWLVVMAGAVVGRSLLAANCGRAAESRVVCTAGD
jgi:hypothetical protein